MLGGCLNYLVISLHWKNIYTNHISFLILMYNISFGLVKKKIKKMEKKHKSPPSILAILAHLPLTILGLFLHFSMKKNYIMPDLSYYTTNKTRPIKTFTPNNMRPIK
jgi:hypothetical protein